MIGCDILLWTSVDSATMKSAHSLRHRSTAWGLYFLWTCYPVSQWRIEFSVPLLTLLQLQSYLVPCISARIFIIPKSPNIRWKQFLSEFFSLCIERLPNCYSVRPGIPLSQNVSLSPDWCFREHLSHALPTERVFGLLRSTRSEGLIRHYCPKSMLDILEVIIKWLQVSC